MAITDHMDEYGKLFGYADPKEPTDPLSFKESVSLGFESFRLTEMSTSRMNAYKRKLEARREFAKQYYEGREQTIVYPNGKTRTFTPDYEGLLKTYDAMSKLAPHPIDRYLREGKLIVDEDPDRPGSYIFTGRDDDWGNYARKNQEMLQRWLTLKQTLFADHPELSDETIRASVINETNEKRAEIAQKQLDGDASFLGTMVGGIGGAMTDPVNIFATVATMPIGGATGYGLWGNAWRAGTREAFINAGSESIIQFGEVREWHQDLGDTDYGLNDIMANVGMATIGGFIFGGAGSTVFDAGFMARHKIGIDAFNRWDKIQQLKLSKDVGHHFDLMQQAELQSINWSHIDLETRFATGKLDAQVDNMVYVQSGDDVFTGKVIEADENTLTVQTFDADGNMQTTKFNREDGSSDGDMFLNDEAQSPIVKEMDEAMQDQGVVVEPDRAKSVEQTKTEQLETDTTDLDLGEDFDAQLKILDDIDVEFGVKPKPDTEGEITPKTDEGIEGQGKEGETPSEGEADTKAKEPEVKETATPEPEGKRTGGSRSWRNKNPGNIEYGDFARRHGAIGSDGRFAIFPTEEAGRNAQIALLRSKNYRNLNIRQAIARYAPAFENNVPAYIRATGVKDMNKKMKDFTDAEMGRLVDAMRVHEGWKPGKIGGVDAPATARYETPEFKTWFKGASDYVKNEDGTPKTVYHGTLKDFDHFDHTAGEHSQFGRGMYFTSSPKDAGRYAQTDPIKNTDIIAKAEILQKETGIPYKEARDIVTKGAGNIMPVHLSIKDPIVLGKETIPSKGNEIVNSMRMAGIENPEYKARQAVAFDELFRANLEPESKEWYDVFAEITAKHDLNSGRMLELLKKHKHDYAKAQHEAITDKGIRELMITQGKDGIIIDDAKNIFPWMEEGSQHYFVRTPEQIKSEFNAGTWSPRERNILKAHPDATGALLGFEQDEDGNWTYDPVKGLMGVAGVRYAGKAIKSQTMRNAVKRFLDDIEETATQQAGGGTPPKMDTIDTFGDAVDSSKIPEVTLEDMKGNVMLNIPADLTRTGPAYRGIDSATTEPVRTMGGPLYPFLQSSVDGKTVWANKGADDFTKILNAMDRMGYDDRYIYAVVSNMGEDTHMSNTTAVHSIFETIRAYENSGRMSPESAQKVTDDIRSAGTRIKGLKKKDAKSIGEQLENIPHFDDIDNLIKYVDNMTFSGRKELITELQKESLKNKEFPNVNKILDELTETEFAGWNKGDASIIFKIDTQDPVVKLGEEGTTKHPSYDYGIKGEPVGKFGRPIHNRVLFPELHKDMMELAEGKGKPESMGENYFYTLMKDNKMVRRVDDKVIGQIPSTPYKHIQSAQQARIIKSAMEGGWRDSQQAKGKVTPMQYMRELEQSKAYPTLDQTSEQAVKQSLKEGVKLYGLSNSRVMYSTAPREDGGVDLHHVINNEKNAPKAGQMIMAHAIETGGVTDLNAFAVPIPGKPEGMLPNFYKKFGFVEVDRYPFDKQYITKTVDGVEVFDETRYNDMIHYWKKEFGWKESDGYPDVVDMKWRGTDADRQGFTERLLTGGDLLFEEGSAIIDGLGVQRSVPDGGIDTGGNRLGDGGVDGVHSDTYGRGRESDVSLIYEEILGLTDAEKKNLGIGD